MLLDALPEPTPIAQLSRREGEMRYMTQHFNDLQGLKAVPLWAGGLALLYAFPPGHAPVHTVLAACGVVLALTVAWASWIKRRYKERYGFVGSAKAQPEQVPGASFATWLCLILIAVLAISPRASHGSIFLVSQAPTFLIPKCFYACPQSGTVRLRRALYVAATVAMVSTVICAAVFPGLYWHTFQLWLCNLLILGLYDHWLLVSLLRPRQSGLAEASHE